MADSSYSIEAIFSANVSKFKAGLAEVLGSTDKLGKVSQLNAKGMGEAFKGVGQGLTLGMTVPLAGIGLASTKAAIGFESAFAGVRKTVDGTEKDFKILERGIRDMAMSVPASASEIAKVAESAGQLGIKKDDILSFSRTMIDLGESTNLSSEEAATALARLANITQMPADKFSNLGSSIVALGNNFATTESEIVAMGLRLAGTGKQIGLSESQIMGLSTAMTSVGINAEAGGSAFSMVMQEMNSSVLSGGKSLNGFAKVAGLSATEFAKKWKENPQEAIVSFVTGLKKVKDSGGDVSGTLKELGINGVREIDTLGRLAGAGDLLSNAFDVANKSFGENTALSKEAGERYKTMESQLALVKNTLTEAGIAIGSVLAPILVEVANKIATVVKAFTNLDPGIQTAIIAFAGFLAVIGPLSYVWGTLIGVSTAFMSVKAILMGVMTPITRAGKAVALLGKAFAFLISPVGLVIVAITALVAGLIYLWNTNEGFRNAVLAVWEDIKSGIAIAVEAIKAVWSGIGVFFSNLWEGIKTTALALWDGIVAAWSVVIETVKSIWNGLTGFFSALWSGIQTFAVSAWTAICSGIMGIISPLIEAVKSVFDTLKGALSSIWDNIKSIAESVWELIKIAVITPVLVLLQLVTGKWEDAGNTLKQIWENIKSNAQNIWNNLKQIISTVVEAIKTVVTTIFEGVKNTVINIWNAIKSGITSVVEGIKSAISTGFNAAQTVITTVISTIKTTISNGFNNALSAIKTTVSQIPGAVSGAFSSAISAAGRFVSQAISVGRNLIMGFVSGVKNAANNLVSAVSGAVSGAINRAKSLLGIRSPSRVFAKFGYYTDMGFAEGISKFAKRPINAVTGMVAGITRVMDNSDLGIDKKIGSISGDMSADIDHRLQDNRDSIKPMEITLSLGGRSFKAFVDDITGIQDKAINLEEVYGY